MEHRPEFTNSGANNQDPDRMQPITISRIRQVSDDEDFVDVEVGSSIDGDEDIIDVENFVHDDVNVIFDDTEEEHVGVIESNVLINDTEEEHIDVIESNVLIDDTAEEHVGVIESNVFIDSTEEEHVDIESNVINDDIEELVDIESNAEESSNIAQAPNVVLSHDVPEPGVENPIIRLENPHFSSEVKNTSAISHKRTFQQMQDDESGQNCTVCLEPWTSVGAHRLCSLKCGHLFGKSCVLRWLDTKNRSVCPQCNSKTKKSDIRELYATKLVAVDTLEMVNLQVKYSKVVEEKRELEGKLATQKELTEYYKKLSEPTPISTVRALTSSIQMIYYKTLATLKFEENSCRVLAYSAQRDIVVLSQKSNSVLWPGFGVRLLSPVDWTLSSFYPLHKKMIRDLVFHPVNSEQLLSVAFDNSIKLFDVISRTELVSVPTDSPLWCCSWDKTIPNKFYCGSGRGDITAYDLQRPGKPSKLEVGSGIPVVAVIKSQQHGFILCCRAQSVTAYTATPLQSWSKQILKVCSGPFVAMTYDEVRGIIILACRPTEEFHFAFRHASYCVTFANGLVSCEPHNVFLAGHTLTRISRPCLLSMVDKSYYFAFNESQSEIWGWCLDNSTKVLTIPVNKPVTDLLAVTRDKEIFLMVLTTGYIKCFHLT